MVAKRVSERCAILVNVANLLSIIIINWKYRSYERNILLIVVRHSDRRLLHLLARRLLLLQLSLSSRLFLFFSLSFVGVFNFFEQLFVGLYVDWLLYFASIGSECGDRYVIDMLTSAKGVVVILKSTETSWVEPYSLGIGTVAFA